MKTTTVLHAAATLLAVASTWLLPVEARTPHEGRGHAEAFTCTCPEGFKFHDGSCHDTQSQDMQVFCPMDSWYQEGACLKKVVEFRRAECPAGFSNLCSVRQLERLSDCCVRSEVVPFTPVCSPPFELVQGSCSRTLRSAALLLCPNERGDQGCVAIEVRAADPVCPLPEVDGQCMRLIQSEDGQQPSDNLEFTCPLGYKFSQVPSPDGEGSTHPVGTCYNVVFATRKYSCNAGYRLDRQHHLCRKANRACASQITQNEITPPKISQDSGLRRLAAHRGPPSKVAYVTAKHAVTVRDDSASSLMAFDPATLSIACDKGEQVQQPVGRCPQGFVPASELDESLYSSRRSRRRAVAEERCVKRTIKPATPRCTSGNSCAPVYEAVAHDYVCPTGYAFLPSDVNWAAAQPAKDAVCALLGTAPATPACMPGTEYDEDLESCVTQVVSMPALRCPKDSVKRCYNGWQNQPCECVEQHIQHQLMTAFCPPRSKSSAWCRYTPHGHSRFYEAICPENYNEQSCYHIELKEDDLKCPNGVMVEKRCVETTLVLEPDNQCGVVKKVDDVCVEQVESQSMCPPGTRMDLTDPSRCLSSIEVNPECAASGPTSTPPSESEEEDVSERLE